MCLSMVDYLVISLIFICYHTVRKRYLSCFGMVAETSVGVTSFTAHVRVHFVTVCYGQCVRFSVAFVTLGSLASSSVRGVTRDELIEILVLDN
jgi:hypothetical protein